MRHGARQNRVAQRQHRVDGIARGAAVARGEGELAEAVLVSPRQHMIEAAEVDRGGLPLQAEELLRILGVTRATSDTRESGQRPFLTFRTSLRSPVPAQHRTRITNFRIDQIAREVEAALLAEGGAVLSFPHRDVAVAGSDRVTEEPTSRGEPRHGYLLAHQRVQSRRRDRDGSEQEHLRHVDQRHFHLVVVRFDDQSMATFAQPRARGLYV